MLAICRVVPFCSVWGRQRKLLNHVSCLNILQCHTSSDPGMKGMDMVKSILKETERIPSCVQVFLLYWEREEELSCPPCHS